jgi:hypothetical protein
VLEGRVLLAASPLALLAGCAGAAAPGPTPATAGTLAPVAAEALTVTSGAVSRAADGSLEIRAPTVRAVAKGRGSAEVELAFVYRGPSADLVPLASGEERRQIGLKLHAQDTCNVIYVMWHIAPTTGIHVAVKSNPGQNTQAQCGDQGYVTLVPTWSRAVSAISEGVQRTLRATIEGDVIHVLVDGKPAWTGNLPPAALTLGGPVGLRSDNGDFDLVLLAPGGSDNGGP